MTVNEFINKAPFKIPNRVIVYGITENSVIKEVHMVYDSQSKKCSGGLPDHVKDQTLYSVSGGDNGSLVLHYKTDHIINSYL